MASKRRKSRSASIPKWKREGFSSYRQYLNARYRALGFTSYSEYTRKRERGEVPSTKHHAAPTRRDLPPVAGLERVSYESEVPFKYEIGEMRGEALVQWLRGLVADIERFHPPASIFSGAYRLFGKLAIKLDDEGTPIFEPGQKEFWVSHMDWPKMVEEMYSIARAFGDHKFEAAGYQVGRSGSKIFALIIQKVRISIIIVGEGEEKPKGPIWRVVRNGPRESHGKTPSTARDKAEAKADVDSAYCEVFKGPHHPIAKERAKQEKHCAGCGRMLVYKGRKWHALESGAA